LIADIKLSIESLEYRLAQNLYPMGERQPIEADDYPMKPMVIYITDILPMVTDVNSMVTDVYPMLAKESSVANPQKVAKVAKIDKIFKKCKNIGWQHCIC
jgi:hypothetical protein